MGVKSGEKVINFWVLIANKSLIDWRRKVSRYKWWFWGPKVMILGSKVFGTVGTTFWVDFGGQKWSFFDGKVDDKLDDKIKKFMGINDDKKLFSKKILKNNFNDKSYYDDEKVYKKL